MSAAVSSTNPDINDLAPIEIDGGGVVDRSRPRCHPVIRAFRQEAVDAIGNKNLVDVCSPDEFAGKILAPAHLPQESAQRPGHIPTALNVP